MTTLRAVCRECLDAYRAPGQLRCAECHQRWLTVTPTPPERTLP